MKESIIDDIMMFIISHSPCLQSIDISPGNGHDPEVTDHTLQLISTHCTGLQSLSLNFCRLITDTGLITISEHCPNLQSLKIYNCDLITDASITVLDYNHYILGFVFR